MQIEYCHRVQLTVNIQLSARICATRAPRGRPLTFAASFRFSTSVNPVHSAGYPSARSATTGPECASISASKYPPLAPGDFNSRPQVGQVMQPCLRGELPLA